MRRRRRRVDEVSVFEAADHLNDAMDELHDAVTRLREQLECGPGPEGDRR